ncbi:MAG: glycosyltransferase family 2 protein [Prevotellaceae bacterium]|nr:glycosyltransferase family 2 protein [Prevotellaceae bacterium]
MFIIDAVLFVLMALTVAYMTFFAFASQFVKRPEIPKTKRLNRFIILIPSYKNDDVIERTVKSVLGQSYPQRLFDVVVISDRQSEMTNFRLAQYPITLLTPNFKHSTKVKSLQYAVNNLPQFKIYDLVVVLDADNIVLPEFLDEINNAYEYAGTKAIQTHRLSKNRDTSFAMLDATFEEINNSIFRLGHIAVGLSSAISGSGMVFDFNWFKDNIVNTNAACEDKELEALLIRQHIYVDYFDHILVFDEKTRSINDFNRQRRRWATTQFYSFFNNFKYLPKAIFNKQYDLIDKILQWMLIPRTIMMGVIVLMSIVLPNIYFTLAVKWWFLAALILLVFAVATPNYLVDKRWERAFFMAPLIMIKSLFNIPTLLSGKKRYINKNK